MILIKIILLGFVFIATSSIGILISSKYKYRVIELKEMKSALNMFKTKIKFTYEPLPEIFKDISNTLKENIAKIFKESSIKMKKESAKEAWEEALIESNTNLQLEDIEIIKRLGKLLGKTDLEGQVSEIDLTNTFLDMQIEKAEKEADKNQKLYKTLRNSYGYGNCNNINLKYSILCNRFYTKEEKMDINLLFKIAAIGILVAVLHQVLVRAGREDQAMMTTLAGLVIVLTMVITEISSLFNTVRTLFNL